MKSGVVFNPDNTPSVAIKLKPGRVRVGVAQVEGYTVLRARDRQETGLTITPAVKIDGNGQVELNKNSWFVNYDRVGQPVGGPFRTRQEAEGLASELARFDWNRAIEEFSDEEIRGVGQISQQLSRKPDLQEIYGCTPGILTLAR